jgi:hypothetical protein
MTEPAAPPASTVLATVMDTPVGPLSLLARDGRLIAGGFTADPAEMHVRLGRELRTLPLETAARAICPGWSSPSRAISTATCRPWTRSPCTSRERRPGSGCGPRCGPCRPAARSLTPSWPRRRAVPGRRAPPGRRVPST